MSKFDVELEGDVIQRHIAPPRIIAVVFEIGGVGVRAVKGKALRVRKVIVQPERHVQSLQVQ